jgi:hypothetical protein
MEKLNILWTTTNRDTITNMIVMYASNAILKGWWDEVNIIVWGASAKLLGENIAVQQEINNMMEAGVCIEACQACADKYEVTDILKSLGIEMKYMGEPFTNYIKKGEHIITI